MRVFCKRIANSQKEKVAVREIASEEIKSVFRPRKKLTQI